MSNPKFFLVGGAVRDFCLEIEPSDFDYVVEASSFESLIQFTFDEGFLPVPNHEKSESGFVEFPDALGLKAYCPVLKTVVDIHCARKEYNYRDGQHPANVEIGSLEEDSNRRDFTCNALLMPRGVWDSTEIIDFHAGIYDIRDETLCTVHWAFDRLSENPDRVIRAIRFACKFDWDFNIGISLAFENPVLLELVRKENDDRKFKSLNKILKDKSLYHKFFKRMSDYEPMLEAIFSNIGLLATNRDIFQ